MCAYGGLEKAVSKGVALHGNINGWGWWW